jgi:hypothetical protein
MMQCRMCSQRLPRPGKLCRECERELELERARLADVSVGELPAAVPLIDASRMAGNADGARRLARLRSRAAVIAIAFTIGLVGAAALQVAQRSSTAVTPASVMLDRDISRVRARSFTPVADHATGNGPVADARVAQAGAPALSESRDQSSSASDSSGTFAPHRVSLPVHPTSTADGARRQGNQSGQAPSSVREARPRTLAVTTVASRDAPPATYDRVLAYSDAVARCGEETFFMRIACEQRARIRYCDSAVAQLPQCAEEFPRDHGQ